LLFTDALEDQGLLDAEGRPIRRGDEGAPALIAWSDIHTGWAGAWPPPL
jgi:hypothetical protein